MSQPSQSSQNYQNIVSSFLNSKRQWQQVPEIVYLTIRALFHHTQNIQDNLYQQKQFIAEQSIKIKELSMEIQDMINRNQIIEMDQIYNLRDSGFKKSKKSNKPKSQRIGGRSQSNKRPRGQYTFSNSKQQYQSVMQDKSLNSKMIQEIKALTQQIVSQKFKQTSRKIQQIYNTKSQIKSTIEQNQIKLDKQIKKSKQQLIDLLNSKNRELQKQIGLKAQSERGSIMRFIQQSSLQVEKIWLQINGLHIRLGQIVKQGKLCYSNPIFINNQQPINKNIKQKQMVKFKDVQNDTKSIQLFTNLNKQLSQFKLKTIKQMTQFIKTDNVEAILAKYQTQSAQKINKLSKFVLSLQKQLQNIKKQGVRGPKQQRNQFKKVKSSQQNLVIIQQSLQNLQNYFKQKLKSFRKQITAMTQNSIGQQQASLKKQIHEELQFRQKALCEIVQTNCDRISQNQQKSSNTNDSPLRKIVQKLSEQMILTRYLHLGQKQCKEAIQWERNVYNSMQQNFIWKNHHIITVLSAGLYRLQVGLYPDNQIDKIQAYVILNDIPISALKSKEVPSNCQAPARGSLFNEAILLPGKSKIWIKVDKQFCGQAYLQILKL